MTRRPTPWSAGTARSADATSEQAADPSTTVAPQRLSVVDDIFWRGHHGMGTPVVMQGVWRFVDRVEPQDLAAMHAAIAVGPLNRRVVSPRVPLARRWFSADAIVAPLRCTPDEIGPDAVVGWADECARVHLDVAHGPVWELALARIRGGGSVVSLACSHLVADGLLMVGLAGDAAAGQSTPVHVSRPGLRDDIVDALWLCLRVIGGVATSLWRGCVDRRVRAELIAALRPRADDVTRTAATAYSPPNWREPTAIVDVDALNWSAALARHQGSSTALLVAVVAHAVRDLRGDGPVTVTVPVAVGQTGMGALSAIEVTVDADVADLIGSTERIRAAARAARDPSATGPAGASHAGPPGGMPAELLQLLGDRIAHAMVPDPGMGDGLASPLGVMPQSFDALAGHRSSGMAVRSVHPEINVDAATATRNTIGAWSAVSSGRVTISVAAPDPAIADSEALLDAVRTALAAWDLTCTSW